jgi:hypothetical protein
MERKRGKRSLSLDGFVPSVVAVDQRTREPQPEAPDKPVVDKLVAEVQLPVAAVAAVAVAAVAVAAVAVAGLVLLRRRRVVIQKDPRVASSTLPGKSHKPFVETSLITVVLKTQLIHDSIWNVRNHREISREACHSIKRRGFEDRDRGVPCSGLFVATALRWDIISARLSGG